MGLLIPKAQSEPKQIFKLFSLHEWKIRCLHGTLAAGNLCMPDNPTVPSPYGPSVNCFQHASMQCRALRNAGWCHLMPLAVCCKIWGEFWRLNWALEWRPGLLSCQLKRLFLLLQGSQSPRQSWTSCDNCSIHHIWKPLSWLGDAQCKMCFRL